MKSAYVIGHIRVKDTEKWNEYRSAVPATLEQWGAELILRGNLASILNGEHKYTDTVVIRFPDMKSINNWYYSPAYQSIIALREMAAEIVLLSFEG